MDSPGSILGLAGRLSLRQLAPLAHRHFRNASLAQPTSRESSLLTPVIRLILTTKYDVKKCGYCGGENVETAAHCHECGTALAEERLAIPKDGSRLDHAVVPFLSH